MAVNTLRDEIRKLLNCPSLEFFYAAEFVDREKLQNRIEETLRGGDLAYSVSHSNILGGAAFAADEGQIGFDLEETARVLPAVALRISDDQQLRAAPTPAALFVAKEAAFKALRGPRQPKVLSEVEILEWYLHSFSIPLYTFSARLKGQQNLWLGVCFEDSKSTVGLSFFPHPS